MKYATFARQHLRQALFPDQSQITLLDQGSRVLEMQNLLSRLLIKHKSYDYQVNEKQLIFFVFVRIASAISRIADVCMSEPSGSANFIVVQVAAVRDCFQKFSYQTSSCDTVAKQPMQFVVLWRKCALA